MFENFKMMLSANRDHLYGLIHGMQDAESRFLDDQYTLKQFLDILEHRVRVGSAPMINQRKLANNYIDDFCKRNNIDKLRFHNHIQEMLDTKSNLYEGKWHYSKLIQR